jgi:hypothetical protein
LPAAALDTLAGDATRCLNRGMILVANVRTLRSAWSYGMFP